MSAKPAPSSDLEAARALSRKIAATRPVAPPDGAPSYARFSASAVTGARAREAMPHPSPVLAALAAPEPPDVTTASWDELLAWALVRSGATSAIVVDAVGLTVASFPAEDVLSLEAVGSYLPAALEPFERAFDDGTVVRHVVARLAGRSVGAARIDTSDQGAFVVGLVGDAPIEEAALTDVARLVGRKLGGARGT